MNYRDLKYMKIMLIVYVLINCKHFHNEEIPYQIYSNSVVYKGGLLRLIESNQASVHIGAKSVLFEVPFDLNAQIFPYLKWRSNLTENCNRNNAFYIQFMSLNVRFEPLIEVCGSDGCHLVCRSYDTMRKIFVSLYSGFKMIPINVALSSKHILIGHDIFITIPSEKSQASLALHFNRSFDHGLKMPMITSHFSFPYDQVNFLQVSKYRDKIYFIFTETASEMINYHNTFYNIITPKVIHTRLGRVCQTDKGIQLTDLFFTTFIKTTFSCQLRFQKSKFSKKFIDYKQAVAASNFYGKSGSFLILFRSSQPVGANYLYSSVFCPYNISDIEKQLEHSKFAVLQQRDSTKYWSLDIKEHNLSSCDSSFDYMTPNTERMVANLLKPTEEPFTIKTNGFIGNPTAFEIIQSLPLTIITPENQTFFIFVDIIFVGTDRGIVAKNIIYNNNLIRQVKTQNGIRKQYFSESVLKFDHRINVLGENDTVTDIKINLSTESIVVISSSLVTRIPLEFCSLDCWSCNSNLDPMCQWNPQTSQCETKRFSKRQQVIKLYHCQSDIGLKSRNMFQEKNVDSFWLIFSLVIFVSIFVIVLTVSIVIRYSPVSLPRVNDASSTRFYQIIQNREPETLHESHNIQNSLSSSCSDSNSLRKSNFKASFPGRKSKSYKSAKESIIIENKFCLHTGAIKYHNGKSKPYSVKGIKKQNSHFCNYTKGNSQIIRWKSCDAIFF